MQFAREEEEGPAAAAADKTAAREASP